MRPRISTLSFQKHFAPLIISGAKPHTIRANAERIRPGDVLHLYTGLRTKQANCFLASYCETVEPIRIGRNSLAIRRDGRWLKFNAEQRQTFATADGFREPDAWRDLVLFFAASLPFEGSLITWTPPRIVTAKALEEIAYGYSFDAQPTATQAVFDAMTPPLLDQFLSEIGKIWAAAEWTKRNARKKEGKQ